MSKSNIGRFFEDYSFGEVIAHAVPRTLTEGERALYHALYPARHALNSSDEFAPLKLRVAARPYRRLGRVSYGFRQNRTGYFTQCRG